MPESIIYNRLPVLCTERGMSRQDLTDEYNLSLELSFRISEFYGLPSEVIFSCQPFQPLSEVLYHPAQK